MKTSAYNIYDTTSQAWQAMYEAIAHAQSSIYWEVFVLVDDSSGTPFFDLLKQKALQGVDVKIVLDYWGSFSLSRKMIAQLAQSHVDIRIFRPFKHPFYGVRQWLMGGTHRKILVVDGQIGFVGGVNVQHHMKDWNDIHMQLRGKIVRSLLRSFAKLYIQSGGERASVEHLLRYRHRVKHALLDFVYDKPTEKKYSRVRERYIEAFMKARERIILFSPYYFPGKEFVHALWQARKRGVKVDLLIPYRGDLRFMQYAAHAWFSIIEKLGVRIHLLKKMSHGKGIVVDDDWAMIGSSNIEFTSFYHNYEVNIKTHDKKIVGKLQRILKRWMDNSYTLEEVKWKERSFFTRMFERVAFRLYKLWFKDSD
ncbi:MAG: phosphatidylserine/phosphatidylglycerophosphate/cardiolipin synthase family protein [Candidatus Magasanikbacteria bacterium]